MNNFQFKEKYNILETFEKNQYQDILMATKKDNPEDVVVINIFKKSDIINNDLFNQMNQSLNNIIHMEKSEDHLIIATEYHEGMPLDKYVASFENTENRKINFAYDFLNKIKAYDPFNNYLKRILINENQIFVNDNQIAMNELIILDDNISEEIPFEKIKEKIAAILKKILFSNSSLMDEKIKSKLQSFVGSISVNTNLNSIDDICNTFKRLYLYDFYLDADEDSTEDITSSSNTTVPIINVSDDSPDVVNNDETIPNETTSESLDTPNTSSEKDPPESEKVVSAESDLSAKEKSPTPEMDEFLSSNDSKENTNKTKNKNKNKMFLAIAALGLTAIILFLLFNPFSNKAVEQKYKLPEASFEKTRVDTEWTFKNTSKVYGEDITLTESKWTISTDDKIIKEESKKNLKVNFLAEGDYIITLEVKDSENNWSEPYSERIHNTVESMDSLDEEKTDANNIEEDGTNTSKEKLDSYSYAFLTDNVTESQDNPRSGTKAIKFDLQGTNASGSLEINDIFMNNNTIVSFWLLSDSSEPITIELTGYNAGQAKIVETQTHTPVSSSEWDMIKFNLDSSLIDQLKLKLTTSNSTIYIDDIDINSYK